MRLRVMEPNDGGSGSGGKLGRAGKEAGAIVLQGGREATAGKRGVRARTRSERGGMVDHGDKSEGSRSSETARWCAQLGAEQRAGERQPVDALRRLGRGRCDGCAARRGEVDAARQAAVAEGRVAIAAQVHAPRRGGQAVRGRDAYTRRGLDQALDDGAGRQLLRSRGGRASVRGSTGFRRRTGPLFLTGPSASAHAHLHTPLELLLHVPVVEPRAAKVEHAEARAGARGRAERERRWGRRRRRRRRRQRRVHQPAEAGAVRGEGSGTVKEPHLPKTLKHVSVGVVLRPATRVRCSRGQSRSRKARSDLSGFLFPSSGRPSPYPAAGLSPARLGSVRVAT